MNTPEPLKMHRVPSRVSSLSWSPQQQSLLAMGDTDGVLWRLDAISGHVISEIDENGGDKIWSICHSPLHRDVIASSWGNGAVSIWDTTCGAAQRICSIQTPKKMPVCSIDICGTFLAMASSDHNVYVYDLRNPLDPHMVLRRHVRPVSYVRFMGTRLVSSSVDGSVVLWDGISSGSPTVRKSFSSHKNEKNFVGLSVDSNQLIACGSEDGSAYVYFPAWEQPVAYTTPAASCFVTSLAWIPTASLKLHLEETPPILAVADTSGSLKLHALIRSEGFQDPASFGSH